MTTTEVMPCDFFANVTGSTLLYDCLNVTASTPAPKDDILDLVGRILVTVMLGIGMIGIGCTVSYKALWYYIKRPKAYMCGVLLQLLLVPSIAWGMARAFRMPQIEKLGVMLMGSCPGGSISNMVVYWFGGVVDLSIAMTATSTLLSLGTMPLWLFVFSTAENISDDLQIPFEELGITLACLVIPLGFGIFLNDKIPKYAPILSKVLISVCSLFIGGWVLYKTIDQAAYFTISWEQIVVGVTMPIITFILGYIATLFPWVRLNARSRKTVAVECFLQNPGVAVAVTDLTFSDQPKVRLRMSTFYLVYYVVEITLAIVLCLLYRLAVRKGWTKDTAEDEEEDSEAGDRDDKKEKGGHFNPTYKKNEVDLPGYLDDDDVSCKNEKV